MKRLTRKSKSLDSYILEDISAVGCMNAVDRLGEYETLEDNGLLLRLPCKVGDTVYALNKTKREIFPSRVEGIEYVVNDNLDFPLTKIKGEGFCVFFDDFGKIVFLTQAEAEQKLKEIEE